MKHRWILALPMVMVAPMAVGCYDDDHDRDWHHDHDRVVVHEEHHAPDRVIVEEHHDHDR